MLILINNKVSSTSKVFDAKMIYLATDFNQTTKNNSKQKAKTTIPQKVISFDSNRKLINFPFPFHPLNDFIK